MRLGKIRIGIGFVCIAMQILSYLGNLKADLEIGYELQSVPFSFDAYSISYHIGKNIFLIVGVIFLISGFFAFKRGKWFINEVWDLSAKKHRNIFVICTVLNGLQLLYCFYLFFIYVRGMSVVAAIFDSFFIYILLPQILVFVYFISFVPRRPSVLLSMSFFIHFLRCLLSVMNIVRFSSLSDYMKPWYDLIDWNSVAYCILFLLLTVIIYYGFNKKIVTAALWLLFAFQVSNSLEIIVMKFEYLPQLSTASEIALFVKILLNDIAAVIIDASIPVFVTFVPTKQFDGEYNESIVHTALVKVKNVINEHRV